MRRLPTGLWGSPGAAPGSLPHNPPLQPPQRTICFLCSVILLGCGSCLQAGCQDTQRLTLSCPSFRSHCLLLPLFQHPKTLQNALGFTIPCGTVTAPRAFTSHGRHCCLGMPAHALGQHRTHACPSAWDTADQDSRGLPGHRWAHDTQLDTS